MPVLDRLHLLDPLRMILLSSCFLPITILNLAWSFEITTFFSWSAFQHAWFSEFWRYYGPISRENASPKVAPLMRSAHGVILDVGPGSGMWLQFFNAENVTHIFGVEPNTGHHAALRESARRAGLEDKYEIVPVGVEELEKFGIGKESIDTVVTLQVLCSIPAPERLVKELYRYLKPGGEWIMYEHVRTSFHGQFVSWWQFFVNFAWPHFFDGCSITRPSDETILTAGDWAKVSLKPGPDEGPYETVPHVMGSLIKRGDPLPKPVDGAMFG